MIVHIFAESAAQVFVDTIIVSGPLGARDEWGDELSGLMAGTRFTLTVPGYGLLASDVVELVEQSNASAPCGGSGPRGSAGSSGEVHNVLK